MGQGLSSIGNFALSIVVARSVGVDAFGAFSLATAVYFLAIELVRPLALEPLIVRHGSEIPGRERQPPVVPSLSPHQWGSWQA